MFYFLLICSIFILACSLFSITRTIRNINKQIKEKRKIRVSLSNRDIEEFPNISNIKQVVETDISWAGKNSTGKDQLSIITANDCIGFLVYCLLSRILPANLKKQLQSSRVNAVAEVLLFAICTFAIMVTAQTWFVHDVLNVP